MSPSRRSLFSNKNSGSFNWSAMVLLPLFLTIVCPVVFANCNYQRDPESYDCKQWFLHMEQMRHGGTVVRGKAKTPSDNGLEGVVHGSHVFGGPNNGAQTVGGGINYKHPSGLHGGVDATHVKGQGNSYGATVGGSTKVGPGTLSIDGAASTVPGSSRVQGQVGATYSVPLD